MFIVPQFFSHVSLFSAKLYCNMYIKEMFQPASRKATTAHIFMQIWPQYITFGRPAIFHSLLLKPPGNNTQPGLSDPCSRNVRLCHRWSSDQPRKLLHVQQLSGSWSMIQAHGAQSHHIFLQPFFFFPGFLTTGMTEKNQKPPSQCCILNRHFKTIFARTLPYKAKTALDCQ